jgi:hypothetical protein
MRIVIDLKEIIEVAKATDAVGFNTFVEENGIEVEYLEYNVGDENDGVYEVYLFEFDTTIVYISGNYVHNEDLTLS